MGIVLSYAFAHIIEAVILWMSMSQMYEHRYKKWITGLIIMIGHAIMFMVFLIGNIYSVTIINNLIYVLLIALLYKVQKKVAVFWAILYNAMMALSELIIFYFAQYIVGIRNVKNQYTLIILVVVCSCKILYFLFSQIMVIIKNKCISVSYANIDTSMILLVVILISSLMVFMTFYIIGLKWDLEKKETIWMISSMIVLVISDILVLWVNIRINERNAENQRIKVELEKERADAEYYKLGNSREDLIKLFLDYLETLYSETMSALKSCEVDFNNPPPIAQMIVSVNDVPLGTQGNLLCITGGEGTGKSNYVAALIAGAIRPTGTDVDALGVTLHENGRNKAVLFYDTEQSEVQLYKNISNLLRRCGREAMPEWFKAYCLTGMSRKERLLSIIQSLDKYHYQYGGVHLVVIDGIADLIKCANDEAESIAVVEELYRLAGIYKTCIVTVLHFIPNGLKLRGHLGSELQRKAAAILSIEKDSDPAISVVKALKVRDGSPLDVPIMQFSWDKEKAMHVYLGEKPKEEKDKRKEDELVAVAKEVFSRRRFVTYVELAEEIQSILEVKERTAKSYIRFMREKEIILKSSDNQSYYVIGNF